ncbi:TetR/AcrR family transcriptional regulator [Herbidospora yilanensis]|uniref:TetR/AcrR family transcriptional regulator n=1 Tax=Herbidospora yilanensis TaxID=354426 RepID=UPI0007826A03|nr:TetR/AcrR family transcriptional regulator [Herbidospora yilanensis]
MARLSRVEHQRLTREKVLAAARAEFLLYGFRDTKIDNIAERAELTRGAVYSNFPGKRALYFAVLAAGRPAVTAVPATTRAEALHEFARAWLAGVPISSEPWLGRDLLPEVMADEATRKPFAQLVKLSAILLGLTLERLDPGAGRQVRVAEQALTILHGAGQFSGFADLFDVVRACEHLAALDLDDSWPPPHLAFAAKVDVVDEPAGDLPDGVVVTLAPHRAPAVEEALRATSDDVTMIVAAGEELALLAELVIGDTLNCLEPLKAAPPLRVVYGPEGVSTTETAVRVTNGRIVARAEGFGACHAVASHPVRPLA